jgi:subtilisin family serine protease
MVTQRRTIALLAAMVGAALLCVLPARGSGSGHFDFTDAVPGQLVVRFASGVDALPQDVSAANSVSVLRDGGGGGYSLVGVPEGEEEAIAARLNDADGVELVEPNYVRKTLGHPAFTPNDPEFPKQWHLKQIQAEQAWDVSTGAGVTVAVLDTGVAYQSITETVDGEQVTFGPAPDLAGISVVSPHDSFDGDDVPEDQEGHGTHVTGTIMQRTNNAQGTAGVAFDATLMPVKVCGTMFIILSGCPSFAVSDGIHWAVDHGANVINMSLGGAQISQDEEDAVQYAEDHGVVVVAAAGNEGERTISFPGALSTVISVGAVGFDKDITDYSNFGFGEGSAHLHLVAPGGDVGLDRNNDSEPDGVLQQTYTQMCELGFAVDYTDFSYEYCQGTSMASPHVAGVAALLKSHHPEYTPADVRRILSCSSLDLGSPGQDEVFGDGLVQARDALDKSDAPAESCVAPITPAPTPGLGVFTWGDSDCNHAIAAPRDAQAIVNHFLNKNELSQTEPCTDIGETFEFDSTQQVMGDWDCTGAVAPRDAQAVLKHFLGQADLSQTEPCPDIGGQSIVVTPTPGPSQIPSSTPVGPQLVFVQNTSWFIDSVGTIHVVGEVVNLSGHTVDFVKISADAFDGNGHKVDSDYNYSCLTAIASGAVSPFDVMIFEPPSNVASVAPYVTRYESPSSFDVGTGVDLVTEQTYTDNTGVFHITGTATNNSSNTYSSMKVCSATYDDSGTVLTVRYTSTAPTTMPPGKVASFHLRDRDADARHPTKYQLWADAKVLAQ